MHDDDRMPDRQKVDSALIWLDPDGADWREAALMLEDAGGRPISHAEGLIYRFPTRAERDRALDRVQGRFGWTIALAFEGRP